MRELLASLRENSRLKRRLVLGLILCVALWIAFFDSHSILRRVQLSNERASLQTEVEVLKAENKYYEERTQAGLTDELVESIAREQYGLRKPGELVFPVVEED